MKCNKKSYTYNNVIKLKGICILKCCSTSEGIEDGKNLKSISKDI